MQKISNTQKRSISTYSRYLYDLRTLTTNLENALELEGPKVNITTMQQKIKILTECYANCSIVLDQFSVLLKSCPDKAYTETEFDLVLSESPVVRCFKNSDEWKELCKKVKAITAIVTKQKTALLKLQSVPRNYSKTREYIPDISQTHINTAKDARDALENILGDVNNILERFKFTLKYKSAFKIDAVPQHPFLASMYDLSAYLIEMIKELDDLNQPNEVVMETDSINELVDQTEDIIANMLLIIQSIYKKHLPEGKESETEASNSMDDIIVEDEDKEKSKDLLEDKHLKERLQENLSSDAKMLQLESLIDKCQSLLSDYVQYVATTENVEDGRNAVTRMVPILEQTVLFVQYFVTQKVAVHRVTCKMLSVLLKIFSDLATKG